MTETHSKTAQHPSNYVTSPHTRTNVSLSNRPTTTAESDKCSLPDQLFRLLVELHCHWRDRQGSNMANHAWANDHIIDFKNGKIIDKLKATIDIYIDIRVLAHCMHERH